MLRLASKLAADFTYPPGTCSRISDNCSEMARSTFGSKARAMAGGRSRPPVWAPDAVRKGSGATNVFVAFGITVLLKRSSGRFSTTTRRDAVETGAAATVRGENRILAFLKRLRNGMVMRV